MDEKRNTGEFSLDDILKEFGDALPEDDVTVWEGSEDEVLSEQTDVSGDTLRLDEITKAVRQQETVSDDTVRFTPVGEEEELTAAPFVPREEAVEPYSDQWEPEYEQPMGEYVPAPHSMECAAQSARKE